MRSRHPIYPQEMVINISNQQQNASLNEILSQQNSTKPDEVILVKNDGILPGADAFPPPFPQRHGGRTTNGMGGFSPGSNSAPNSGNLDGNCPSNPTPKFPYQFFPNNRSQNKKKNKKNSIEVKIVNGEIIVRVTRDDMPFFIDEMTARKKIYHAPDFDVALPDNLDLEYVKSLSTKDRLKYLSDPGILPQKCVGEYMKKLGQHLLDPNTEIKVGTLGGNGATKG